MGGYGSTRWDNHTKAALVERCLSVDTADLNEIGFFDLPEGHMVFGPPWGEALPWIHWIRREFSAVTLCYTPFRNIGESALVKRKDPVERPEGIEQRVDLLTTRPHFGGIRYWFACPGCRRRVRTLHLPPGLLRLYMCRTCHGLTYQSSQWSRSENAQWRAPGAARKRMQRMLKEWGYDPAVLDDIFPSKTAG